MTLQKHAIHRLYEYRKAISSRPFTARGKNIIRCQSCLLAEKLCTCRYRKQIDSELGFMLIMYDDEVLKPSNSGRLIADIIPDTHAFIWSRSEPNRKMLSIINDPSYQPYVIFPSEYAVEGQQVVDRVEPSLLPAGKKPLLILLDGSWREAIKMFRKSEYLHHLPLFSFSPESTASYALRKGARDFQLGTAEVAALALSAAGETENSAVLESWFAFFVESSLHGRSRNNREESALTQLKQEYLDAYQKVAFNKS
ncbi:MULTISPECIES: tRNA-uridine aminocarboxypropyltransferase [unclassified Shewanella]|uniref:tRNA-uridine aminocarboxypropyltransferase n=1 Tax=unclassified Shewanella TaxID=196818 RepID=UPI001C7CF131|nr:MULTISPECIES: tRNA-uridine aminocarboxypropyltransferase [unclassified Shewanella]GIU40251.1 DTW domain-containing protein [Shewanella sp. MBTL60-112-B2]